MLAVAGAMFIRVGRIGKFDVVQDTGPAQDAWSSCQNRSSHEFGGVCESEREFVGFLG